MMDATTELLELPNQQRGSEIHMGPWLAITQERIDDFARVTGDVQWIHTDVERARRESPYGTTVAHGYLTLSLLPCLTESNHPDFFASNYPGMRYRVKYGLNRVRFPAPVKTGARIRARSTLLDFEALSRGVQIIYLLTIEIEGEVKPACIAESVVRVYP
jgi:acyl dehydratase